MLTKPKKSLGQNFLIDKNILQKIVNSVSVYKDKEILEIGPGTGNLTNYLIKKKPKKIFVVEKDNNLSLLLSEKLFVNLIYFILIHHQPLSLPIAVRCQKHLIDHIVVY